MVEQDHVKHLEKLGSGNTVYKSEYCPEELEKFENKFPGRREHEYLVELECPEFTALCPKTGQPDFANITIRYTPDKFLVESKSLKLYLFGFRNHGSFHEEVVNMIAQDLYNLLEPLYLEVRGDFMPRGGISINPVVILRKVDQK